MHHHRALLSLLGGILIAACGDDSPGAGDTGSPDTSDTTTPGDTISPPGNHAPQLARVGDRRFSVGAAGTVELGASDPDGDALTFFVASTLPPRASFDRATGVFAWTPDAEGQWPITFGVSDGSLEDRETIYLTSVAERHNAPPRISAPSLSHLEVGQPFTLVVEASDPDGDTLTLEATGLPAGASFDPGAARLAWTPGAGDAGRRFEVLFAVSDGVASDATRAALEVASGNRAPVFTTGLETRKVLAGETLQIPLTATDPDGDAVSFALRSDVVGASIEGATLVYAPHAGEAARVVTIPLALSDGQHDVPASLDVQILARPNCNADSGEADDTPASARAYALSVDAPVGALVDANLCDLGSSDVDHYAFDVPAGASIVADLLLSPTGEGFRDLDLELLDGGGQPLARSAGSGDTDYLVWGPGAGARVVLRVTRPPFGGELLAQPYRLLVALYPGQQCTPDAGEPNDDLRAARPPIASATQCTGNPDFWLAPELACGQHLRIDTVSTPAAENAGFALVWGNKSSLLSIGNAYTGVFETDALPPGRHLVEITGWASLQTLQASYSLSIEAAGAQCADDARGNLSAASAAVLQGDSGAIGDGVLCCGSDWFALDLGAGDDVDLSLDLLGGTLVAVAPGSSTALAVSTDDFFPELHFRASSAGRYLIKVMSGAESRTWSGESYTLDWSVERAPSGSCTWATCGPFELCDAASRQCVLAECGAGGTCPSQYTCIDELCVVQTSNAEGCRARDGFDLKANGALTYCAPTGPNPRFASCNYDYECQGSWTCVGKAGGPAKFCSTDFCSDSGSSGLSNRVRECDAGSVCVPQLGGLFTDVDHGYCAMACGDTGASCPSGYTCSNGACR